MRSTLRIAALIVVLLALIVPLTSYASGGQCPDDPVASANCNKTAPPYYVVINRSEQHLTDRPGTGCQPWILKHPECCNCSSNECCSINIEAEVCGPMLAKRVPNADGSNPLIYEMCCDCAGPDGTWKFRIREWRADGTCPVTQPQGDCQWIDRLPPGTGIDLPPWLIVGGLALLGAVLLGAGVLVRRRTVRLA